MHNMEFNHKDEVVIVDETKQSVFEKKQVNSTTTDSITIELKKPRNWIDAYSDCA